MKRSVFKQYSRIFLLPFAIIIGLLLLIYLIINAPALLTKLNYYYKTEAKKEEYAKNNLYLPSIDPNKPRGQQNPLGNLEDNHLYIPSLNISAPIVWGIVEEDIVDNLKNGVVQFGGSSRPDGPGNVFITGHSSYYWWVKSDYKQIFALLVNIKQGDQVIITYKGEPYIYKVTENKTIKPSNVSVIDSRGLRELTLATCVPVGTDISRFIVKAALTNNNDAVRKASIGERPVSSQAERPISSGAERMNLLPKVN